MTITRLNLDEVTAEYHSDTRITHIIYGEFINPQVTSAAYKLIAQMLDQVGVAAVSGCIFDFTQVKNIEVGNVQSARRESNELNEKYDLSLIPTALVVETAYQEGMIKVNMKFNPQQDRIRLVRSVKEGREFIKDWHESRK